MKYHQFNYGISVIKHVRDQQKMFATNYWSSTENNANNAWNQNMSSGNQNNNNKTNSNRVRAIRRVPI